MTRTPSGHQYELVHGDQRAVVVEVGAGVRSYRSGVADIVDGYRRDEECTGSRGQVLAPWPNRIAGGRYAFAGRRLQLPVNEPRTGSAIHGLIRSTAWHRIDAQDDMVALVLEMAPQAGYPFALGLRVEYSLDSAGLRVRTTAANRGHEPCPYGCGAHPYVRLGDGGVIDDAVLHVPADVTLDADDRGIPTGADIPVAGTAFDFRVPRRIGTTVLDTAFTSLRRDEDGIARITLTARQGGGGVVVWMDRTQPFAMIYSGDTLADGPRRRHGLAIEPMTCAPDAFNSGAGLIVLQPGETHTSTWGIAPQPPADGEMLLP